jgi:prevent-host-death family protein
MKVGMCVLLKVRPAWFDALMTMRTIIDLMYMKYASEREIDVTALMELDDVMYTSYMTEPPELDKDLPINKARNELGKVIERARYFDGVTYLLNRGKRVAAIVPVAVAERYEAEQQAGQSGAS